VVRAEPVAALYEQCVVENDDKRCAQRRLGFR
jgi:phage terminase large subunit-like protein